MHHAEGGGEHVSVHAADKIRIGYPDFNSSTFTLPLAHLRGFFQEEGLQAELIRIRSAVALPALTSGEIDYHTVVSPALIAALRGIPVRLVACFAPGLTTAIIARPEFKTIQDLKGKTIGLNSIGGGLESTVRMGLDSFPYSIFGRKERFFPFDRNDNRELSVALSFRGSERDREILPA